MVPTVTVTSTLDSYTLGWPWVAILGKGGSIGSRDRETSWGAYTWQPQGGGEPQSEAGKGDEALSTGALRVTTLISAAGNKAK